MEMSDFSKPSGNYKRNREVESALRGSISFGRFLSDLDWEKWSAFSHNKLLEEAKNCSVPGSVAQKKAYFEAHYRRSATLKLTAEMEPINDKAKIGFSCTRDENEEPKIDDSSCMKAKSVEQKHQISLRSPCKSAKNHGLEKMEGDRNNSVMGVEFHGKHSLQFKSSNRVQNNESEAIPHDCDSKQQEQKAMKDVSIMNHQSEDQNKKKSAAYIIKSVDIHKESRISSSSASRIQKSISKENKPPHNHIETSMISSDRRKPASGSHMSTVSNSIQRRQKSSLGNKSSSFYEKVGDLKVACTSSRPLECPSSRELRNNHIKTPARAPASGPKHTFSTPQVEHKRTQTPLCETSSTKRKADAKLGPLSINCFKSPKARENRQPFGRSVSCSSKTTGKIPVTKPDSPNLAGSNSKSSVVTPLLRSSCRRNKTRQMNV